MTPFNPFVSLCHGAVRGRRVLETQAFPLAYHVTTVIAQQVAKSEETSVSEKIWVVDDEPSPDYPVWTRANVGEVFPDIVTPMGWTMWGVEGAELGWRDALVRTGTFSPDEFAADRKEIVGSFGGYCYLNVSVSRVFAIRVPGFTWQMMDQTFFGDQPAPPYKARPQDEDDAKAAAAMGWLGYVLTTEELPELVKDKADVAKIAADRPDLFKLSNGELVERCRSLVPMFRHLFGQHLFQLYCSTVATGLVAGVSAAVGQPAAANALISGLGGVDSAEQSLALWELSRLIKESPALTSEFNGGVSGLWHRLTASDDKDIACFVAGFENFLAAHGSRGPNEWDLSSPTWETHPEMPLTQLERMRFADDGADPKPKAAVMAAERAATAATLGEALAGDPDTQGQFLGGVRACSVFLPGRERTKTNCIKLNHEIRLAVREIGRRLVAEGHLDRIGDVVWVADDEMAGFLNDPASMKATIASRKAEAAELRALEPPFVFDGAAPGHDSYQPRLAFGSDIAPSGTVLTGLAGCAGTHTGRARVLTEPGDPGDLEPGDILVAVTTDSSWGPLFLTAGAVVVDTGAAVSHAVIVSRELGIPCAVSVVGATQRIANGQW